MHFVEVFGMKTLYYSVILMMLYISITTGIKKITAPTFTPKDVGSSSEK